MMMWCSIKSSTLLLILALVKANANIIISLNDHHLHSLPQTIQNNDPEQDHANIYRNKLLTSINPKHEEEENNEIIHKEKINDNILALRGGSMLAGWHPLGYGITELGLEYLSYDGSLDSDVGRFLATFKSGRKRYKVLKEQWLEVVRVSKSGQSMRVYRKLDELLKFCVNAGFLS